MSTYLVLLRHGQSVYNKKNLFTGIIDVQLSRQGIKEALKAKKILKNYVFNYVFSSALKRAIDTADIVFPNSPIIKEKALNERNYGELSGKNKHEVKAKYGEKQFLYWRRSYLGAPPLGESLKNTYERVIPYFTNEILPLLKTANNILVVAHGNSLRALIKLIENISDDDICKLEIPTAYPMIYKYDEEKNLFNKIRLTA